LIFILYIHISRKALYIYIFLEKLLIDIYFGYLQMHAGVMKRFWLQSNLLACLFVAPGESALQCVVVCCSVFSVLQCVQCVAVCCSVLHIHLLACLFVAPGERVLQCVAVCCSVLQCAAVCCSVLQCVAVHCVSLLEPDCIAAYSDQ